MNDSIRNPYTDESPIDHDTPLFPRRHACGRVLFADLSGDYPVFYARASANDHRRKEDRPILSCPHCDYPLNLDWMRPLYLVEPMPYEMAVRTESRKVCSNCWGQVVMSRRDVPAYDDEGNLLPGSHRIVLCHLCRYETLGYVTQRWVGHAREQDYLDYGRCLIGLSEALEISDGLPIRIDQPKSQKELLAAMGF